jgi:hypothetical protein
MLRFEWNALRVGDTVFVHDPGAHRDPAAPGTVVTVDTKTGKHDVNGVGIRVGAEGGGHRVVWPSFLTVHHDPSDPIDDCWRCAALAEATAKLGTAAPLPVVGAAP